MQKIIILGTDLHGEPTELASKTVFSLKNHLTDYKIVSMQHRKPIEPNKKTIIIPKVIDSKLIRKPFQALCLPITLLILRMFGYSKIFTFWVAKSYYHKLLFKFLKLIGYNTTFTIISGEDTNPAVLFDCSKIVCQSERMKSLCLASFPKEKVKLIYPSVNLNLFSPSEKSDVILIPSVPYDVKDFRERGIDTVLEFLKQSKISSKIIFRSEQAYNYVKSLGISNTELINKSLSDKELSKLMSEAKIIPLLYEKNAPDMPYSAVEALSSGCAIVCTDKMGISDVVKKEKAGIVIKSSEELGSAVSKIISHSEYNKNARKAAEKYFKLSNIKEYLKYAM